MVKQVIQAVKGTRDFYPEDMAFRNWLYGKIKEISEKFGYQEFDGPVLEYLDLYTDKTSEEILKTQAFTLKDGDGNTLILRPELTPTFARMVAQKSQELPKPIRWFAFGRTWRYERPQKGRAREFFQWEINLLGPESPEADAEILSLAVEYLKALKLTPGEVVIRVSDREYLENQLFAIGVSKDKFLPLLRIIDRKDKISVADFQKALRGEGLSADQIKQLEEVLENKDYTKSPWLSQVFASLKLYDGVLDYIVFDPLIVRGFDYYTRTVFEAWDKGGKLKRSLFGGGRFDNLTAQVGGERIPGVGMAPGDIPTQIILEEYNKMPKITPKAPEVLVTVFGAILYPVSLKITLALRSQGINTEIWLDTESKLDKQLKYADRKGIPYVIIIGPEEAEKGLVTLKNLEDYSQETVSLEDAIKKIKQEYQK